MSMTHSHTGASIGLYIALPDDVITSSITDVVPMTQRGGARSLYAVTMGLMALVSTVRGIHVDVAGPFPDAGHLCWLFSVSVR